MKKNKRLGSSMDSLFADNDINEAVREKPVEEESTAEGLRSVRLSQVEPDRRQPRKDFDRDKLSELADNIAKMGVLQPILVRPSESGRYTIVAGERRWRAARLAGLTEVPVIIRELTDAEAAQIALVENLQREDLNPIEEAEAFRRLRTEFGMTQEAVAEAVGKSRAAVANSLRLLELPERAAEAVRTGKLSVGHAKVLCGVADEAKQEELLEKVLSEGISVRELENLVEKAGLPPKKGSARRRTAAFGGDKELSEYSLSIKNEFGVDALFKKKKNGSTVMSISFKNDEDLKDFLKHLSLF